MSCSIGRAGQARRLDGFTSPTLVAMAHLGATLVPQYRQRRRRLRPLADHKHYVESGTVPHAMNHPDRSSMFRYCGRCGVRLPDDVKYCLECGTRRGQTGPPIAVRASRSRKRFSGPVVLVTFVLLVSVLGLLAWVVRGWSPGSTSSTSAQPASVTTVATGADAPNDVPQATAGGAPTTLTEGEPETNLLTGAPRDPNAGCELASELFRSGPVIECVFVKVTGDAAVGAVHYCDRSSGAAVQLSLTVRLVSSSSGQVVATTQEERDQSAICDAIPFRVAGVDHMNRYRVEAELTNRATGVSARRRSRLVSADAGA